MFKKISDKVEQFREHVKLFMCISRATREAIMEDSFKDKLDDLTWLIFWWFDTDETLEYYRASNAFMEAVNAKAEA